MQDQAVVLQTRLQRLLARWALAPNRSAWLVAGLIALAGLVGTGWLAAWQHGEAQREAAVQFERLSERIELEVERRLRLPIYGLKGARGLFAGSNIVQRSEFAAYVDSRQMEREFPGVRGFGFIERVLRPDLDRFLAAARADAAPAFTLRSAGAAADLLVIKYIEPLAHNQPAMGFDLGSEPVRREAAERAIHTGEETLSGLLTLVQDNKRSPGFLLLVPIYRLGADPQTPAQRKFALLGLTLAPIVTSELLTGVADVADHWLDFELIDANGVAAADESPASAPVGGATASLMFDSVGEFDSARSARGPSDYSGRAFVGSRYLDFGGRQLLIRTGSTAAFERHIVAAAPRWVAACGVALSLLLAHAAWLLLSGRARALALARAMTVDLERLARAARDTSNSVVGMDRQFRITWVNEGFTRVSGYSTVEALNRDPFELSGSAAANPFTAAVLAELVRRQEGLRAVAQKRRKDGSLYWVDSTVQPEFDERGRHTGFSEISLDISARHELETEIRASQVLLSSVLDALPCALSVFDADLNLVAYNQQFVSLLDFPPSLFEATPVRFESLIRFNAARGEYGQEADMEATVRGRIERARSMMQNPHQFERLRPNGTSLEVRSAPMPGGGWVTTYFDITERKRAEAELRSAEDLLRGAVMAVDEAFVLYDADDRLVFCNEKYRQLHAVSGDLIVPGVSFEALIRDGAERGQYTAAIGRVEAWVAERMALHRQGGQTMVQKISSGRWLRVVGQRMADGHTVGFCIDITDLMLANEAALAASRSKSQFLATMSHEIRTPMNAVLGLLTLLRRTKLAPRQLDYVSKIQGAAHSLLRLLNEILDFSKVEAGKMSLDPHVFRSAELFRSLEVILAANLGAKPVGLLFDIDPALPLALLADSLRLQQVLINLGNNAVKFTERGVVVLSVRVLHQQEDHIRLEFAVSDTGIGIALEHQAQIFSGFNQAEASTTRRFGGTGLGLAISQRLVKLMGGELRLDSTTNVGSRFHFRLSMAWVDQPDAAQLAELPSLPSHAVEDAVGSSNAGDPTDPAEATDAAEVADAAAVDARSGNPARPLQSLRLLVVDDNLNNQQVTQELLEEAGAVVQLAHNGQLAVDLLRLDGTAFDAVLMDVQMPVMDGYTATRLIRAELGLTALPIVAMTANVMAQDRQDCLDAGMNDHVGKPVEHEYLLQRLLSLCGRAPLLPSASERRLPTLRVPAALLAQARAQGLDAQGAMDRFMGKTEFFVRMAQSFAKSALDVPAQLSACMDNPDMNETATVLHNFKGLAATVGADQLAALGAQGERLLKTGQRLSPAWVAELARQIRTGVEDLLALARAMCELAQPDSTAAAAAVAALLPTADPAAEQAEMRAALPPLMRMLRDFDMGALATFEHLRVQHAAALGAQATALDDALAALDFGRMLVICHALLDAKQP